ncbi:MULTISPECIES: hypothetical protein [Streptomyces]|uniref:hypothetical protein n=1 Tax=Streptomyces TaxID=1883 RepID=UPI0012B846CB|nr:MULTISPECIES: hypothetical protein [Streptomyces]
MTRAIARDAPAVSVDLRSTMFIDCCEARELLRARQQVRARSDGSTWSAMISAP